MKARFSFLFILLFAFVSGLAAQNSTLQLFNGISSAETQWSSKTSADISRMPIEFNQNLLDQIRRKEIDSFQITDFDDDVHQVTIRRVMEHYNGDWSITAYLNDEKLNSFTLSFSEDRVLSTIQNHTDHEYFEIRYSGLENRHSFIQVDPHEMDVIACGIHDEYTVQSSGKMMGMNLEEQGINDEAVIDVMVVYTPRAKSWADLNGGIDNIINQSMAVAQNSADNSDVGIEFRLVFSSEVDYEESESPGTDLRRLTTSPEFNGLGTQYAGYMDEVHDWRDEFKADLVAIFVFTDATGGLGWLNTSTNGDDRFGFSLSRVQQAAGTTHAHEMGHNMGNAHSRLQSQNAAGGTGGLFPYSTGWRWVGQDNQEYASVMTYNEGATGVEYFSNPNITFQGVPTGSYTSSGAPADNARSMREIKHAIANYRVASDPPLVETDLIFDVTAGKAVGTGTIVDNGGSSVTDRGICWNTTPNPTVLDNCQNFLLSSSTFTVELTGLRGNTTYYARAYARNNGGTSYGENVQFTTMDISSVSSLVTVDRNKVLATGQQASRIDVTLRNSRQEPVSGVEILIEQDGFSNVEAINSTTDANGQASFSVTHDREESIQYSVVAEDLIVGSPVEVEFLFQEAETFLGDNYPNPFNNQTRIPLVVPETSRVKIDIFNAAGAHVATVLDDQLTVGYYEIPYNASALSSGVYFYRLTTSNEVKFEKMLLLK
jgi:hypothetical protein